MLIARGHVRATTPQGKRLSPDAVEAHSRRAAVGHVRRAPARGGEFPRGPSPAEGVQMVELRAKAAVVSLAVCARRGADPCR